MKRLLVICALLGAFLAIDAVPVTAAYGFPLNVPTSSIQKAPSTPKTVSYTDLLNLIRTHRVRSATVYSQNSTVYLRPTHGGLQQAQYPAGATGNLAGQLAAAGAAVTIANSASPNAAADNALWPIVILIFVFLPLAFIGVMLLNRKTASGGIGKRGHDSDDRRKELGVGLRENAQVTAETRPKERFSDVAGCDEAVEEIREFSEFLQHPARFEATGARIPSGACLYGPPGTGKTLLAKAAAGETGCAFFSMSGSEFTEIFIGVGPSRIRELFAKAKEAAPSIIFIDELDAIGRARSASPGGGGAQSEQESTLNQLLIELDGFNTRDQVVVFGATNRLELLDSALLRPGRLSRQVMVDLPDEEGRRKIIAVHAQGKPLADDVDFERLAHVTSGASGADLAEMINEAAIMAARADRTQITEADLEEGFLRSLAGPEKRSSKVTAEERPVVAHHEAGHVLCAELCPHHEKAQRTTIKARARAAGLAIYGRVDRALLMPDYLHEQLVCMLGGRAAEATIYGTVSSGAANDLQRANALARNAVEQLGFSPKVGQIQSTHESGQAFHLSDQTRQAIDEEVERLVSDAYRDALQMLGEHRPQLERLAARLLEAGDLDRAEIVAAISGYEPRPLKHRVKMGPRETPVEAPVQEETVRPKRQRRISVVPRLAGARGALAALIAPRPQAQERDDRRPAIGA